VELVDMSFGKTFDIHESVKFQIRMDATNAFNHANFSLPGGGITGLSAFSGQVVGQAYLPTAAGAQQISGLTNGGRTVQLAGRLEF
jgi:hypothetical protein